MKRRVIARRASAVLVLLTLALAFGWAGAELVDRAQFDAESAADRRALHVQVAELETANELLAEQVRNLGAVPVAEPDGGDLPTVVPLRGPQGIPGVTGPRGRKGDPSTVPGLSLIHI